MRLRALMIAAGLTGAALATAATPAFAACQRLGFTVNDYGKEGPTKDAKELLDKHIAKKMAERGVTKYNTGKKSVKCELFLDVILFDEHTCTAEATVCWDNSPLPKSEQIATEKKPAEKSKPAAAKAADAETPAVDTKTTTGSISKPVENKTPEVVIEKVEKIETVPAPAAETPAPAAETQAPAAAP